MKFLLLMITINTYADIEFIAHRGQSSDHKENSIQAIKAAVLTGFDYIEIDIHRTRDGKIIAIHDDSVNRTTEFEGKVRDLTLEQIKKMDPSIPTLNEVYELLAGSPSKLIVEIKNTDNIYPGVELEVVMTSRNYPSTKTTFKSFSRKSLDAIHQFDPGLEILFVTIGPLWKFNLYIDDWLRIGSILDYKKAKLVQVHKSFLNKSFVEKAHANQVKVIAWDVQTFKDYMKVKKLGVDLIETDHPPASLTLIQVSLSRFSSSVCSPLGSLWYHF